MMNDLLDIVVKLWPILLIFLGIVVSLLLPDEHVKDFDPQPEPPGKTSKKLKK